MVLMNFVAFAVFKILYNLFSMQNLLTADISKIWKTVQRDLIFIFDVLLGSAISFVLFLVPQAIENVVSFTLNGFSRKRGGVTMRNYKETCKGICGYNLVHNFFVYFLPLKSSLFVVHFSNAFQHGKEALPKHGSQTKIVPLLVIFDLTQLIQWFECFDFTKLYLI